ncbi:unnamed protein product [Amoebophrya sp. A120]|nr:unnamed protein product [Amoebophrya sp. A120]|eukprot:GSA120T00007713001.1
MLVLSSSSSEKIMRPHRSGWATTHAYRFRPSSRTRTKSLSQHFGGAGLFVAVLGVCELLLLLFANENVFFTFTSKYFAPSAPTSTTSSLLGVGSSTFYLPLGGQGLNIFAQAAAPAEGRPDNADEDDENQNYTASADKKEERPPGAAAATAARATGGGGPGVSTSCPPPAEEQLLKPGDYVEIHGLTGTKHEVLNGKKGLIMFPAELLLDTGDTFLKKLLRDRKREEVAREIQQTAQTPEKSGSTSSRDLLLGGAGAPAASTSFSSSLQQHRPSFLPEGVFPSTSLPATASGSFEPRSRRGDDAEKDENTPCADAGKSSASRPSSAQVQRWAVTTLLTAAEYSAGRKDDDSTALDRGAWKNLAVRADNLRLLPQADFFPGGERDSESEPDVGARRGSSGRSSGQRGNSISGSPSFSVLASSQWRQLGPLLSEVTSEQKTTNSFVFKRRGHLHQTSDYLTGQKRSGTPMCGFVLEDKTSRSETQIVRKAKIYWFREQKVSEEDLDIKIFGETGSSTFDMSTGKITRHRYLADSWRQKKDLRMIEAKKVLAPLEEIQRAIANVGLLKKQEKEDGERLKKEMHALRIAEMANTDQEKAAAVAFAAALPGAGQELSRFLPRNQKEILFKKFEDKVFHESNYGFNDSYYRFVKRHGRVMVEKHDFDRGKIQYYEYIYDTAEYADFDIVSFQEEEDGAPFRVNIKLLLGPATEVYRRPFPWRKDDKPEGKDVPAWVPFSDHLPGETQPSGLRPPKYEEQEETVLLVKERELVRSPTAPFPAVIPAKDILDREYSFLADQKGL